MKYRNTLSSLAIFLSSALLLSGCLTGKLHHQPTKGYSDTFSSVLISANEKTLVVITPQYHYIFPAPAPLVGMLKSPVHKAVTAKMNSFVLSSGNRISGDIELCLANASESVAIEAVKKIGFKKVGEHSGYCSSTRLKGERYSAGELAVSDNYKLNQAYSVYVQVEPGALTKGAKLALTPVTLALDGTLIIAGSPLLLAYIIVLLNSEAPIH